MKKAYILIIAFIFSLIHLSAKPVPFYYSLITSVDKKTSFLAGLYPDTYAVVNSDPVKGSSLKLVIINQNENDTLVWRDYKVYILLKDGTLFYNYRTTDEKGVFACEYTLGKKEMHTQNVCFHNQFNTEDIQKVWLSFNDALFIELAYNEGEE
jgi:hypothetical protein